MDSNTESIIDELLKDYRPNINNYVNEIMTTNAKELKDFKYIPNDCITKMKLGGYVKYVNKDGILRNGGILVNFEGTDFHIKHNKFIEPNYVPKPIKYEFVKLVLKSNGKFLRISITKNLIFYKGHVTLNDKFRDLFITTAELEKMKST